MSNQPIPAPVSGSASDLIASLRYRAPRVAMAIAAAQLAWPAARDLRGKVREHRKYTVKVPATDDIYDGLHEWVLGLLPAGQQRALIAFTAKRSGPLATEASGRAAPRLRLRYDGTREQGITIAGHRIRVSVASNDQGGGNAPVDDGYSRRMAPEIVFTMSSEAAQRALLGEINEVVRRHHEGDRKPVFRMLNRWSDWERLDDLPHRDLDSVILPDGQLERLTSDVAAFIDSEADYVRRCIPWHRGHLYEGPPGTGKTSVARAIASHFGMDVWYLPLADIDKDANLLAVINRIGPRSMLLLEDVDVFHAATRRDESTKGVTLSGLLNALDGIATPHGLLTVLTTNTPEILDRAVIRPGRIDLVEHFGNTTGDQAQRLLERWYGRPVSAPGLEGLAPAEVIEACKRHENNPSAALSALLGPVTPPQGGARDDRQGCLDA